MLALVNEVKGRMDHPIEEMLPSADYEDLTACGQEELPGEDRRYWDTVEKICIRLEELRFRLLPVFVAFRVSGAPRKPRNRRFISNGMPSRAEIPPHGDTDKRSICRSLGVALIALRPQRNFNE